MTRAFPSAEGLADPTVIKSLDEDHSFEPTWAFKLLVASPTRRKPPNQRRGLPAKHGAALGRGHSPNHPALALGVDGAFPGAHAGLQEEHPSRSSRRSCGCSSRRGTSSWRKGWSAWCTCSRRPPRPPAGSSRTPDQSGGGTPSGCGPLLVDALWAPRWHTSAGIPSRARTLPRWPPAPSGSPSRTERPVTPRAQRDPHPAWCPPPRSSLAGHGEDGSGRDGVPVT